MTRPEAIAYLKELKNSVDICYACPYGCATWDDCDLKAVIDLLEKEQENDDRMDAFRYATMELAQKMRGVRGEE